MRKLCRSLLNLSGLLFSLYGCAQPDVTDCYLRYDLEYSMNVYLMDMDSTQRATVLRSRCPGEDTLRYHIRSGDKEFFSDGRTRYVLDHTRKTVVPYVLPGPALRHVGGEEVAFLKYGPDALKQKYTHCREAGRSAETQDYDNCTLTKESLFYSAKGVDTETFHKNKVTGIVDKYTFTSTARDVTLGEGRVTVRNVSRTPDVLEFSPYFDHRYLEWTEVHRTESKQLDGLYQAFPGMPVERTRYPDVEGKEIELSNAPGERNTIIMLTNADCQVCTVVANGMNNRMENWNPGLRFIVYGPLDNASTLLSSGVVPRYHPTLMDTSVPLNHELSVFRYPSFVLIDAEGKVDTVVNGYTDFVKGLLHENFD